MHEEGHFFLSSYLSSQVEMRNCTRGSVIAYARNHACLYGGMHTTRHKSLCSQLDICICVHQVKEKARDHVPLCTGMHTI